MFFKKIQQKRYNKFLLNELERKIDITTDNLIEHLLMCLLLKDSTDNLNHYKDEVYSSFNKTCLLTGNNKFPTEKILYNMTLDQFSDVLPAWINGYIEDINYKENVNINNYDSSLLTNYIIEYYKWLISILAKRYFVKHEEVNNKINILIDNYDKETIKNDYV